MRGVWCQALSLPRPPVLWAGCRGPLPTGCGCRGMWAWGHITGPTERALASWLCALWGRHEGARGGGASCLGVGRPGSGALPPPSARPLGGLPGPTTHWLWVGRVRAWGPVTNPTARALACCGGGMRVPGGAPPAWVWGVRGRALSHPRLPALWAGCQGPLPTGCGCGGVRAWGPVTDPTARALASWLCALWGRHEGARGRRPLPGCGASGVGRSPTPTARPLGGLPGPTTHWLWVRGDAGVGTRHQPHSARSCELALRAVGAVEGARGGLFLPGCGASGVGRSPNLDCSPSGQAAGAHYPLAVGMGGCGRGDPSPTRHRALLRAGFARGEGGMRVPGGGASCLGVRRPGSGALPPPTAGPLGGLPGPTTHWLSMRGAAGVGTRHQPHSAHSCELALRAVRAA